LPRGRPPLLRPVPQREERLLAALRGALAGDRQHLVTLQERGRQPMRHGREGAVVAAVTAEPGQRDEDLLGVRDHARPPGLEQTGVTHATSYAQQLIQQLGTGGQQRRRLVRVDRLAVGGPSQRTANAGLGRVLLHVHHA
jgi:hypothetical protein